MAGRRGEVEARPRSRRGLGRQIACAARWGMSDDEGVLSHGVQSSSSAGTLIFEEASERGWVIDLELRDWNSVFFITRWSFPKLIGRVPFATRGGCVGWGRAHEIRLLWKRRQCTRNIAEYACDESCWMMFAGADLCIMAAVIDSAADH